MNSSKLSLTMKLSALLVLSALFLLSCYGVFNGKKEIEKKQIILISVDTLRGDHITPYGYFRDTSPNLVKLVDDSVYYTHSYANGCWTLPSHMSLFTGTLPSRHGINISHRSFKQKKWPKLNESLKTIAEVLKAYRVKTIKFAGLPNVDGFENGFEINNVVDPFVDDVEFNRLLKELENHKEKDFFLFIHTWKVHAPYTSSYFLEKGRLSEEVLNYINHPSILPGENSIVKFRKFLKKNKLLNVVDCVAMYDGGIHYVDRYIGRLIDKTKQLGIYNDLMFIVVSDHGEHFADHYPKRFYNNHGGDHYEEYIQVPLIIKYPQQAVKPEKRHESVSLIDVFPTVLDFYGIEIPAFVQGESLLKPHSRRKPYIVSEAISLEGIERKMIRVGNLKYIVTMRNPSKSERANWDSITKRRLFDLKNDPLEKKNLYNDLEFRSLCIKFEEKLKRIIKKSASTNRTTGETTFDQETLDRLKALGYL